MLAFDSPYTFMMKFHSRYILLAVVIFSTFYGRAYAQLDTRSFLSVTAGYSLPVGELAREKINDPFAGLSGEGRYLQASYDFRIARWFGLRISGSMNSNKTKPQPIIDRANDKIEELRSLGLIKDTSGPAWQTSVSNWKFNALMAGPAIYLNFGRVQLEGHAMGGYVQVSSPRVHMTGKFPSGKNDIEVGLNEAITKEWGIGGGASLRIPIYRKLYFHLSGDFLATEAELKDVAIRVSVQDYPQVVLPINEKRFVGVANVGVGLGLAF
jgi:hypothetical protein